MARVLCIFVDLPTGATIVVTFGAVVAVMALVWYLWWQRRPVATA
ncbi:MAG TPA: hypothetical protein VF618_15975 [Thermoanaerobaculia bacterium]